MLHLQLSLRYIRAVLTPSAMIHTEEDLLYPGRICANEADKILKNSDYVMPQVTQQCVLVLQVSSNLICEDLMELSPTKFEKFLVLYFTLLLVIFICYDISI